MHVLRRLIREPLLHFLVLGGLLFGLFEVRQTKVQEAEIVVATGDVERIAAWFQATWQRPPSNAELHGALDDYVRQEVLYRAALSLGLESDDTVVHRRMSQKMEFLLEQGIALPTEADLRTYYQDHESKFRGEEHVSFHQIFLSSERSDPEADARALLPRLVGLDGVADFAGDEMLLPASFETTPISQIRNDFGDDFARALAAADTGKWVGPLKSAYGLHLVFVTQVEPATLPPFEAVRDIVEREWFAERRAATIENEYRKLLAGYHVRLDYPNATAQP